jgi:hypothetical protein
LNRRKVGQRSAEPTLVHEIRAGAIRLFLDHVLRLLLGADEEDHFVVARHLFDGGVDFAHHDDRLREVDDVDAVAFLEDVRFHLRIPATGLMPEMDAGFEERFHGDDGCHRENTFRFWSPSGVVRDAPTSSETIAPAVPGG